MGDIAIRAEGLGKLYRLGARVRYRTLRDTVTDVLTAPFRRRNGKTPAGADPETIWALRDVSLEVKHGEVIGVIGRNGAGKSTLLKILSRITEPTEGRARIQGRIGSLLEVGTGFHPELSGRDNTYLNGAILGMKKAEIRKKFDEIVDFAEVEKFIDTPVKHYSSGMYVRLAFAVAAHLEPEILVVDEVLAVGDHQFQAKCLNKMSEVGRAGRTIFFVSHSMSAIQRLCGRVIVLNRGRVQMDGDPARAIEEYLSVDVASSYSSPARPHSPSIVEANVRAFNDSILISVQFSSPFPLSPPVLGFLIYDALGNPVFGTNSRLERFSPAQANSGRFEVAVPIESLRPGTYTVSLWLADYYADYCHLDKVLQIQLAREDGMGELPAQGFGHFYIPTRWRCEAESGSPLATVSGAAPRD